MQATACAMDQQVEVVLRVLAERGAELSGCRRHRWCSSREALRGRGQIGDDNPDHCLYCRERGDNDAKNRRYGPDAGNG